MVSSGNDPSSLFCYRPCGIARRGAFLCLNSNMLKKAKILFVGVSKTDDFRHVDMEGESNDTLRILWPPVVEASLLRIFRKSVST